MKSLELRSYHCSDADLKQKADSLKDSMLRDASDFVGRNINKTRLDALALLITTFDDTTTDEELRGELNIAVNAKDAIALSIETAIRPIRNMADIQYNGTGKYKTFGFDDMTELSDSDLYRMSKRVVRIGTSCFANMTIQGLTKHMLDDLSLLNTQLDAALDAVEIAIETRDLETQDRIIHGNALWKEMSILASVGQSLFADTNEAKHNDYVLNDNPSTTAPNPIMPE